MPTLISCLSQPAISSSPHLRKSPLTPYGRITGGEGKPVSMLGCSAIPLRISGQCARMAHICSLAPRASRERISSRHPCMGCSPADPLRAITGHREWPERSHILDLALEAAWTKAMGAQTMSLPFNRLWDTVDSKVPPLTPNLTSADNGERIILSPVRGDSTIPGPPAGRGRQQQDQTHCICREIRGCRPEVYG